MSVINLGDGDLYLNVASVAYVQRLDRGVFRIGTWCEDANHSRATGGGPIIVDRQTAEMILREMGYPEPISS